MMQLIKLAWRNLWRSRRRTLITLASVLMAVALAIAIRSLQIGVYGNMIGNAVRFSTGYIQIHAAGYYDDQSINNSFVSDDNLQSVIDAQQNISLAVPRLESFALASSGQHTKGVGVMGIHPDAESEMNNLNEKIVQGTYFKTDSDTGILIGDGLADYLKLKLGDTLVLLGQGFQGATAAGKFPIRAIFHFPLEEINNTLVYLSLGEAQTLFAAQNRLTSYSIMLNDPKKMDRTRNHLQAGLDERWEVMEWPAMNKALVQEIQGDNAGGLIMLGILYMVVAFGVFGTILMMTMERKKEFAVMVAIGLKPTKLSLIVILETIFIGMLGVIAGAVLILPVLIYLHWNPITLTGAAAQAYQEYGIEPILPTSLDPALFINQGILVLIITCISGLYPILYVNRFKIAETLKI